MLGAATPLASAAIIATMLTAINRVHLKNGPFVSDGGYEYNLVLIAAVLALTETGPGAPSIDSARGSEAHGVKWVLIALLLGAAGAAGAHVVAGPAPEPAPAEAEPAPPPSRGRPSTRAAPAARRRAAADRPTPAAPAARRPAAGRYRAGLCASTWYTDAHPVTKPWRAARRYTRHARARSAPGEADGLVVARLEGLDPVAQGLGVVLRQAFDVAGHQAGALQRLLDPRQRQRHAVGEHEALRERPLVLGVEVHQLGDPVVEQPPAGPQQAVEGLHVEVDPLLPHVLDHPDARDRVEGLAGQLAVVGQAQLDPVLDARPRDALAAPARPGARTASPPAR